MKWKIYIIIAFIDLHSVYLAVILFMDILQNGVILNMLCKIRIRGSEEKLNFGKGFRH